MKNKMLFNLSVLLLSIFVVKANNIQVTNVSLTNQNTTLDYTMVEFDISWENSWRTSTLESNWDAAWVFVKYRKKNITIWNHATLNISGHTAPAGATITVPSDGKGAFIYRSADGIGNISWTDVQLRWNYGADGLQDYDSVEVCVFAIEMVYIPQGAFDLGDGTTINIRGQFQHGINNTPFRVTSEAAITLGGSGAGNLRNNNASGMFTADDFNNTTTQTLPAAFPKGYNAFYIMKYEITQEQYVEFLNRLTYTQQSTRTAVAPNSAAGTGALVSTNANRNGIDIMTPGISASVSAVYACNFDGDATYNENNDGQNIACNYLTYTDLIAYLDWAGLRPLTELEYEKACRGNLFAAANEYAWGDITAYEATGIANGGLPNELATGTLNPNVVCCNVTSVQGPLRVGNFARAATNRQSSGGSYFGVMELSGNLWERVVSVGNNAGRSYTGTHGDGNLDAAGNANEANWPPSTASGTGLRGGDWSYGISYHRISDRYFANYFNNNRFSTVGGRGCRTAP